MRRYNDEQREVIRPHVKGLVVHDLGAGDLVQSHDFIALGAKRLVAVDRHVMPTPSESRIECWQGYFRDFHEPVDVAIMSWPINHDCGLTEIAQRSRVVIYLGKNTDASACGTPTLFRYLSRREILAHVPDWINTLIVYGPEHQERPLLPEEYAAIHQERMWSYKELMADRWTSKSGRLIWDV